MIYVLAKEIQLPQKQGNQANSSNFNYQISVQEGFFALSYKHVIFYILHNQAILSHNFMFKYLSQGFRHNGTCPQDGMHRVQKELCNNYRTKKLQCNYPSSFRHLSRQAQKQTCLCLFSFFAYII